MIFIVLGGGVSYSYERNKYRIIVSRPGSNVTTQLRVYAENMEEARENVALNGWQILSIEDMNAPSAKVMRGQAASADDSGPFTITVTKTGSGEVSPEGEVLAEKGSDLILQFKPGACDKISKILYNSEEVTLESSEYTIADIQKSGFVVAVFEKNGNKCDENGIFSADLSELTAIYFELGKYNKSVAQDKKDTIKALPLDKAYVVIGHTDDVKVIPNEEYADNFQLSRKRAGFVKNLLEKAGIKPENIKTVGLGPAFPAAPNKKEGQPLNRRAIVYERR